MHSFINIFTGILLAAIAACGPAPKGTSSTEGIAQPETAAAQAVQSQEQDSTLIVGKEVYDSYCLACHQSDGSGVPGMYPPLTDTAWLADQEQLIQIIIEGLSGRITVAGKTYNQVMPTHNFLDDNQIAAVLNYIRKQYGNTGTSITPEQVTAQRHN